MNFAVLSLYTKVFSAKFGVWRPLAMQSEQSAKVFSAIVFSPIRESFLPRKFPAIQYVLKFIERACR